MVGEDMGSGGEVALPIVVTGKDSMVLRLTSYTVTEVREAEESFHKEVTELSNAFADRFSKGEIENALEYPDDIHAVRHRAWLRVGCHGLARAA